VIQQWGLDSEIARAIASHHREPASETRDAVAEVIFLAERVDVMRERKTVIDLDALWSAGRLTGDRKAVADALAAPTKDAAA
jgi:HD-like signal output (HDOD) protein